MTISVSNSGARAKSRIVAIRLATLTLRCMENWARLAGGYDEAMILVAVVAITSERLLRVGFPSDLGNLEVPLPAELLAGCSVSSIASATGLNRETARRKVLSLVDAGFLELAARGRVRFPAGKLQQNSVIGLVRSQLEAFVRTADALEQDGALSAT